MMYSPRVYTRLLLDRKKYMVWSLNARSEKVNENKNKNKKETSVINKRKQDIVHAIRKVGLFRSVSLFNKNVDIKFSAHNTLLE
jgi:hypothetical protein